MIENHPFSLKGCIMIENHPFYIRGVHYDRKSSIFILKGCIMIHSPS